MNSEIRTVAMLIEYFLKQNVLFSIWYYFYNILLHHISQACV